MSNTSELIYIQYFKICTKKIINSSIHEVYIYVKFIILNGPCEKTNGGTQLAFVNISGSDEVRLGSDNQPFDLPSHLINLHKVIAPPNSATVNK